MSFPFSCLITGKLVEFSETFGVEFLNRIVLSQYRHIVLGFETICFDALNFLYLLFFTVFLESLVQDFARLFHRSLELNLGNSTQFVGPGLRGSLVKRENFLHITPRVVSYFCR